ncbi:response regulator transcription factor [Nonomuraea sp. B12E4]|uniref:response regulator transcription factor n=1 Tax=Nonomuraea sp. B12E4 TaxID=3153564 RepID=UPI00325C7AE5
MRHDGERTTIVLADDHALFREGLRELLEAKDDLLVIGEAGDGEGAVLTVADKRPDLVLLDVEMPGADVIVTVKRIKAASPRTQIIVLSMHDGPQLVQGLLTAGIRGYLLKTARREELISAIRSVRIDDGRVVLAVSRESLARLDEPTPPLLSGREREVLELTAQALSNNQIAGRLSLTEATVKRHLHNVFVKLGAVSRIDAVNKAIEQDLISTEHQTGQPRVSSGRPGKTRATAARGRRSSQG